MSEAIGSVRTLKRKNVKGLALAAPAPRSVAPSASDAQLPGANTESESTQQTAQLEIGIEYKLDLKREDLEVLKELGHGNGGTVSKVRHMATGTIMARKVNSTSLRAPCWPLLMHIARLYTSKLRRKCAVGLCESCRSCMIVIRNIS